MKIPSSAFDALSTLPWLRGRSPSAEDITRASTIAFKGLERNLRGADSLPPPALREDICWNARYRLIQLLGEGAQGVVYLAHREGVDGFSTRVAVKFFRRCSTSPLEEYFEEMRHVARQAQRISEIQNDNLIEVRDFVAVDETRAMVMEWVDGYDLNDLLDLQRLERLRHQLSRAEWERLIDVVVSPGPDQCRLKPGIAVDIVRGCLAGLSDLHHHGIVHCDLKPSNIMIKRTGTKKIIDFDSSCVPAEEGKTVLRGTPYYMSPEQLRAGEVGFSSDIASLGYVLVEMLTGRLIFRSCESLAQLIEAKLSLPQRLRDLLPVEVQRDPLLFGLCRKMVAVDPQERFPDADAAELDQQGAASFHRKLIKKDLSTEYDRELSWWIEACHELDP
ncbi:MAG: serine/threonine protein kinase [Planctomycetes bacterium]|nr:serine/threonine protein kinase [Planctomycetota bacterium]